MEMSLRRISEKLQCYNPQVYLSNDDTVIKTAKLIINSQTEFAPDILYVGTPSYLPAASQTNQSFNILCVVEEIPFNYMKPEKVNLIVLKTDLDLYTVFNSIQDILAVYQKFLAGSSKLMDSFLSGQGLQRIIDTASEVLGNPIILSDSSYKLIAFTKNITLDEQLWDEMISSRKIPDLRLSYLKDDRIIEKVSKSDSPLIFTIKFSTYRNMLGKAIIDNKLIAHLGVIEYLKSFEDEDIELASLLCKLISAEMQKNKLFRSTKRIIYEHFITDLLDGKISKLEIINERCSHLDLDLKDTLYVLTINIEEYEIKNTAISYVRDQLEGILPGCKSVLYNDQIILIIDRNKENPLTESELEKLSKYLEKSKMNGGLSRSFQKIANLINYYHQSVIAIKLGNVLNKEKVLYNYEDYAIFHLIDSRSEYENVKDFCHPALFSLMEYDRQHETSFTQSLYVYLENTRNIVESARLLNIHRNSLRYRIEKIQEIMKLNLENNKLFFHVYLSFKILGYLGEIQLG